MTRFAILVFALFVAGCGREGESRKHAASFDALLSTGQIDRVQFIHDDAEKTNMLASDRARVVLEAFASGLRSPVSAPDGKNYAAGRVLFFHGNEQVGWVLHYIPAHDSLSYGYHYFRLKGTNELRRLFE